MMKTDSLAEAYLIRFQSRIAKPIALLDFIDRLEVEEILSILRELTAHPESLPLIKHEALAYLTSAFVLKCGGVPIVKKSKLQRLRGILKR